jgi:hypothetical protein
MSERLLVPEWGGFQAGKVRKNQAITTLSHVGEAKYSMHTRVSAGNYGAPSHRRDRWHAGGHLEQVPFPEKVVDRWHGSGGSQIPDEFVRDAV